MEKIKRDGILPDTALIERHELNHRMIAKLNRGEDVDFILQVCDHLVQLDNYLKEIQKRLVKQIEADKILYRRMQLLNDQMVKSYKDLLENYKSISEQEKKNIEWILQTQNRLKKLRKENQELKKRGSSGQGITSTN